MTQQMIEANAAYQKALARANAEGLMVGAYGTFKATGQRFYGVTSSRNDGMYVVRVVGHSLVCNCPAGAKGVMCKHRALTCHHLMTRAAEAKAQEAQMAEAMAEEPEAVTVRPEPMMLRHDNTGPRLFR